MTSVTLRIRGGALLRLISRAFSGTRRCAVLGAAVLAVLAGLLAPPAAAEPASRTAGSAAAMMTPAMPPNGLDASPDWSYAQWRGLGCERCNNATHYCVVNVIRFEYACAPRGNTIACAGSQGTRWCRVGQTCWDGVCR